MKTPYILIGIVLIIVIIGGVVMLRSDKNPQASSLGEEVMTSPLGEDELQPSLTVVYSDGGYSPRELMIKKGDTVIFKNESSQLMWTASAIHPSHTVYPGTSIQKCISSPDGSMFDACAGTPVGSSWTFQFNELGSWGYHNHLVPTRNGTIVVE